MKQSTWWWLSTALSAVLLIVLINAWKQMNRYVVEPPQLVDAQAVDQYLSANWENRPDVSVADQNPLIRIKTGIFIQSLQFFNSSDVNLSGYIWQRYRDGVHDTVKPDVSEAGFILPEQVNSGSDIEPRAVYRVRIGDEEGIGW